MVFPGKIWIQPIMKASTPKLQTQKLQGDLPWAGDHAGIEAEDVWHLKMTCRWLEKAKVKWCARSVKHEESYHMTFFNSTMEYDATIF